MVKDTLVRGTGRIGSRDIINETAVIVQIVQHERD